MKRAAQGLYEAATLCKTIAYLAYDLERDSQEFAHAMTAITELANSAHDRVDYSLRQLNHDPGIGYVDPIRAELDEALSVAKGRASDATS